MYDEHHLEMGQSTQDIQRTDHVFCDLNPGILDHTSTGLRSEEGCWRVIVVRVGYWWNSSEYLLVRKASVGEGYVQTVSGKLPPALINVCN